MEIDVLNVLLLSAFKLWILLSLSAFLLSRSRNTSAATLHALLFLVLLGLAGLPLLAEHIPGFHFSLLPADFRMEYFWSYTHDPASRLFTILGSLYLSVVAGLWLRRLLQIRRVYSLLREAKMLAVASHSELVTTLCSSLRIKRRVRLAYSDRIATPLTVGDIHPWILLPRESFIWDENRLRRFLLHELAHIARGDWFVKQFCYVVVAIFWIVPAAWRVLAKLEWLAELACDDVVISAEGQRADYANDLLDVTASRAFVGAIGLTEDHSHYDRIAAVLDGGRVRHRSLMKFFLHALVFLCILFVVAGIRLAHVAASAEPENYQLRPLVILDVPESFLTDKDIHSPIPPAPQNDLEPLPRLQSTASVSAINIVSEPLEKIWSGNANDVIHPLVKVIPEYPPKALRRGREGVVEVAFSILPTGETAQIRIQHAQPPGVFDKAAIDAVKQYRYAPQDVEVHGLNEVFEFRLLEDAP